MYPCNIKVLFIQQINVTENILFKDCTIQGVRNFDQKSSDKLDSDNCTEFVAFWKIPGVSRILLAAANIRAMKYSTKGKAGRCQACFTTFGRNFNHLLNHNLSIKCFLSH